MNIKDIFDINNTPEDGNEDLKEPPEPQSFSSLFPEAAAALKPFDVEILWRTAA